MTERYNITPWLLPAVIALATPFIYDFYVSNKNTQEILWAYKYNDLERADICSSEDARARKLYLYNKSKKIADVEILSEDKITDLGIHPKHTSKLTSDANGVTKVTIKGLKSRETVQMLLCGEKFTTPSILSVTNRNDAYDSSRVEIKIKDRKKESRRESFIFALLMFIGLSAFLITQISNNKSTAETTKTKEED